MYILEVVTFVMFLVSSLLYVIAGEDSDKSYRNAYFELITGIFSALSALGIFTVTLMKGDITLVGYGLVIISFSLMIRILFKGFSDKVRALNDQLKSEQNEEVIKRTNEKNRFNKDESNENQKLIIKRKSNGRENLERIFIQIDSKYKGK